MRALLAYCIHSRIRHFTRLVQPGIVDDLFDSFHSSLIDEHFAGVALPACFQPIHLDHRELASLSSEFGGHGLVRFGPSASAMQAAVAAAGAFAADDDTSTLAARASHSDAGWFGSWAAVWSYARSWFAPLRGQSLATRVASGQQPFRRSVQAASDRIFAARAAVSLHPHLGQLPPHFRLPSVYSHLTDGRLSPATVPLGGGGGGPPGPIGDQPPPPSATLLYSLDDLDSVSHVHAHRASSATVSALEFLRLYSSASPAGRARLLDGSAGAGPTSWRHRVPVPDSPFIFHHPDDHASALAWDSLVRPPQGGSDAVCRTCTASGRPADIALDGRHLVTCPHGLRLHTLCHNPTRDTLVSILDHAFGSDRVIAERPGSMKAITDWMSTTGTLLRKRPDIVLVGLDGPRSYVLIDIKTIDVAGPTWIATAHTDTSRLAAHRVKEEAGLGEYFVDGDASAAAPAFTSFRLVTFVVSTFGSLGAQAQSLITSISGKVGRSVPASLLDQTSWATPSFAPFVRMAMTMAVRRQMALGVRSLHCSAADAARIPRAAQPIDPSVSLDRPPDPAPAAP